MMKGKMKYLLLALLLMPLACLEAASVRVGVLLPLKDATGRGTVMVEFYRGLLMAIDAAKEAGIDVDCYAVDCGSSDSQMKTVLERPELAHLDVIFGPLEAGQMTTLSEFCRSHRTRLVVPFNTPCPQVYSNPWVYQVGVVQELLYPGITNLVIDNLGQSNFVFYHSTENDERGISFTSHLAQVLKLRGLRTTNLNAGGDEFAFDRALNQFRNNVVVIDSRSRAALSQMIGALRAYQTTHPEYKISLLGYPEWLTYVSTLLHDFYHFNAYVYSPYYRNPLSGRTVKFDQQYLRNFSQPSRISYPRAEMLGYDLGQYFILGLARHPDSFDEQQPAPMDNFVQHNFRFHRVGEHGGFVNTFVQLVHYNSNNTIQTLK